MSTFGINPGMSQGDIVGATNYLLANIGQGLQTDLIRGTINVPNGTTEITNVYQLTYEYAEIAFADDQYGNGFSAYPDGKLYWGLRSIYLPIGTVSFIGLPQGPGNRYNWYPIDRQFLPIPSGSSLYYNVVAPYLVSTSIYIAISGSTPHPGYREWLPGLDAQLIDTFIYSAPLIQAANQIDIITQYSAPRTASVGTITVADGVYWDPAGIAGTTPYVAFYNGVSWVKLG
jgi:hypothetical protein